MKIATKEVQYQDCLDLIDQEGLSSFGLMSNATWNLDPKRLVFLLSRYKFVAKMFSGMSRVLEVGCADAFGTRVVVQEVQYLKAIDFDPIFVADVHQHMAKKWKFDCEVHDILKSPVNENFDGAYSLDVLEHIPHEDEMLFIANIVKSLADTGVLIIGSPSIQSQVYASPQSKAGHINCKNHGELKALLSKFFHNVFIFSMNDEVVHTGFYPMAHYLFALCCYKK